MGWLYGTGNGVLERGCANRRNRYGTGCDGSDSSSIDSGGSWRQRVRDSRDNGKRVAAGVEAAVAVAAAAVGG